MTEKRSGSDDGGRIITFYSYKGGTGRTMALANAAWLLAAAGHRVLMIDWDLEAPGLHRFFHPFLDPGRLEEKSGVINMIDTYCVLAQEAATERARLGHPPDAVVSEADDAEPWWAVYADVTESTIPVNWRFDGGACLDFVSASRQGPVFSNHRVDWDLFYNELEGSKFLDEMRRRLKQAYDYILIDSRTGISDIETICTKDLPDDLVICFTLSDQNIDGAAEQARLVDEMRQNNSMRDKMRILPVVTRVEDAETDRLEVGLAVARSRFSQFVKDIEYWNNARIPYKPRYAYEELLAVFGDEQGNPASMLAACERLVGLITDGEVTKFSRMTERDRLFYRKLYTRVRPPERTDVYISNLVTDESWAEWLRWLLNGLGYDVLTDEPGDVTPTAVGERMRSAGHTLAVLSAGYQGSELAKTVRETHNELDPGRAGRLIALRVDEVELTSSFRYRRPVDIVGKDEPAAVAAILRALDIELTPEQALEQAVGHGRRARYPRSTPDVWRVPARLATFTGREEELTKLRHQLQSNRAAAVLPQAVYGLGGVGKTALALEYAWRNQHDYDVIWWIRAEQRNIANEDLAELGIQHLKVRNRENIATAAAETREALRTGQPYSRWLLIFDNADDPDSLGPLLPATNTGHILVTTRNPAWNASLGFGSLEIEVFEREDSVKLLQRRVTGLSAREADLVADELGDLPLAVELAAAWLETSGMAVPEYLARLRTEPSSTLDAGRPNKEYGRSVVATWRVAVNKIRDASPAAARLLQLLSFCGPEPIALDLIYSDAMVNALLKYNTRLRNNKMLIGRYLQDLGRYALVKVHRGALDAVQVHRLIQQIVREDIEDEQERQELRSLIHSVLAAARPVQGDVDNPDVWEWYAKIWPHVFPSDAVSGGSDVRQLYVDRVRYLRIRGELQAAVELSGTTIERWVGDASIGPDDERTLSIRFELACALRAQGDIDRALEIDTDVRERQIAHPEIGKDHIAPLMTAGGLGADYRFLGRFEDALELDEQTYKALLEGYGSDHPRTLIAANNLAISFRAVGRFADALRVDQQTYQARMEVHGPTHHYTFSSAINLARDLRDCGDRTRSLDLLLRTYRESSEALGEENPRVKEAALALAISLRKSGRRDESAEILAWLRTQLGDPEEVDTLPMLGYALNAASDRAAHGDLAGALRLARQVLGIYREKLPASHPDTLVCLNNVGVYLRKAGRVDHAHEVLDDALTGLAEAIGDSHLLTLGCAINLANAMADGGDHAGADALYAQTETRLRATLNVPVANADEHPDVLACASNRVVNRYQTGEQSGREAAEIDRERLLTLFRSTRGVTHPHVVALNHWQRIDRELDAVPW